MPPELVVSSRSKTPRGGWQGEDNNYYSSGLGLGGYGPNSVPSPHEMMRQEEIEQLPASAKSRDGNLAALSSELDTFMRVYLRH